MNCLKGQCHEMEGLNIFISTFCVCADCFQSLSKAFHYPIQLLTFNFAFLKLHTYFEKLTETLIRIPFSVNARCSFSAELSLAVGKMRKK
jgi:hypothetical protein